MCVSQVHTILPFRSGLTCVHQNVRTSYVCQANHHKIHVKYAVWLGFGANVGNELNNVPLQLKRFGICGHLGFVKSPLRRVRGCWLSKLVENTHGCRGKTVAGEPSAPGVEFISGRAQADICKPDFHNIQILATKHLHSVSPALSEHNQSLPYRWRERLTQPGSLFCCIAWSKVIFSSNTLKLSQLESGGV